jgi:GH18 family chitinase
MRIGEFVVGCYYTNWAQHRKDDTKFLPKHIDPKLCTHIYFAFANIDVDKMKLSTFERNDISDSPEQPVNSSFSRFQSVFSGCHANLFFCLEHVWRIYENKKKEPAHQGSFVPWRS